MSNKTVLVAVCVGLGFIGFLLLFFSLGMSGSSTSAPEAGFAEFGGMSVSSPSFANGTEIPSRFGCTGLSPPLSFSGVPEGASTLALVLDDPDAHLTVWTHWVVWNIPANTSFLLEGALPEGAVEGKSSYGVLEYNGPCPPRWTTHKYHFTVYALDAKPNIAPGSSKDDLLRAMDGHVLAQARLYGTFTKRS